MKRQMHFNPDKCEVMRITHRKGKTKPIYMLGGQFRLVRNTKDLLARIQDFEMEGEFL